MMLRSLVGLVLFLSAAGLSLQAADGGQCLRHDLDDSRSLLERLSSPRELTEQEKQCLERENQRREEESRRLDENRKRVEDNVLRIERMAKERTSASADAGVTFEFKAYTTGPGSHFIAACLIDNTGKVHTFDSAEDPDSQAVMLVDERDYLKAIDLAKSLSGETLQRRSVGSHLGISTWRILERDTQTLLKIDGDYEGALTDMRAVELLKLLDSWCPHAQVASSRVDHLRSLFFK
jgi:hypothetical protein